MVTINSKGLGIGGGGGKLKAWADRLNRLPYIVKGFKTGTGSIKQGMKLYDHFSDDDKNDRDAISKEPVFDTTLSPMDSLNIQNSRNNLPDSLFNYSYYAGFSKGQFHKFGTGITKKDSVRYMEEYQLDSMVIIEVYQKFKTLKRKQ